MVNIFDALQTPFDQNSETSNERRKKNLIIGFTATPDDHTLARFGEFSGYAESEKLWVQVFLLLIYILIAYAVFSASRKEEQNRVWVGMAKETAHQLGTPISGIIGWIENLKSNTESQDPEQSEILFEMERDVNKLQQVADRFSKIGSIPELQKMNLIDELLICKNYIEARASKLVEFQFPENSPAEFYSMINSNLFHWVIENLLRNALDAMDGKGVIKVNVVQEEVGVNKIFIQDTGKGIPASKLKTVFKPPPGRSSKLFWSITI